MPMEHQICPLPAIIQHNTSLVGVDILFAQALPTHPITRVSFLEDSADETPFVEQAVWGNANEGGG